MTSVRALFGIVYCAAALGAQTVDFNRQVHPILASRCVVCHSTEKRSGGLSLATLQATLDGGRSGATVRPGKGAESLLIQRMTGEMEPRMPMGGRPVSETEIALIRKWIDEGARATPTSAPAIPKWEAPLSLTKPAIPGETRQGWDAPLDRFTATYLAKHKITPADPVADATYYRRVSLDIQGLLPPPAKLQAFLADKDPAKRQKLVEALLADNHAYAEHWISFWNDLLRNDEGVNYYSETASRKSITPWLLSALEKNMPYDEMTRHLLNPTGPADPEGFLIGVNWRGTVSASQTPALQAAQNTAQIFLGVNLKCNSCHDSFISKWKLKDAYALAAYFSEQPKLQLYRCDVAQEKYTEAAFLFKELDRGPAPAALKDRRALAADIFTDPRNGRLARTLVNRLWQRVMGRGLVEDPDEMDGEPWSPELLDYLAADFAEHHYDIRHLLATILTSRTYQLPAVTSNPKEYTFRGPEVRRLTAEEFADGIGAITGEWHTLQSGARPTYTREWHTAASPLTKALGRPIRDQVYSVRDNNATTLQALELVNGEALTHWLNRGAKKLLGQLPPEPVSLFNVTWKNKQPGKFDIDISKAKRLYLVVQDRGSYSPEKVEAAWNPIELIGPKGRVPLESLKPLADAGLRLRATPGPGIAVKTPSVVAYDIAGMGFVRLTGNTGIENAEITSDLNPQLRFFIFDAEPNLERLTPPAPETPLPAPPVMRSAGQLTDWIFWYALGRAPSAAEKQIATQTLGAATPSAEGLADLLWAVTMKPEFQLIH